MGFQVKVNDEVVWESSGDPAFVKDVVITNASGEIATVGSNTYDSWINVNVTERAEDSMDLDLVEWRKSVALQQAAPAPVPEVVEPPQPVEEEETPAPVPDLEF